MPLQYSSARSRRMHSLSGTRFHTPNHTDPQGYAEAAIAWLSVVDDFKLREHKNIFPRWSVLFAVLAVITL